MHQPFFHVWMQDPKASCPAARVDLLGIFPKTNFTKLWKGFPTRKGRVSDVALFPQLHFNRSFSKVTTVWFHSLGLPIQKGGWFVKFGSPCGLQHSPEGLQWTLSASSNHAQTNLGVSLPQSDREFVSSVGKFKIYLIYFYLCSHIKELMKSTRFQPWAGPWSFRSSQAKGYLVELCQELILQDRDLNLQSSIHNPSALKPKAGFAMCRWAAHQKKLYFMSLHSNTDFYAQAWMNTQDLFRFQHCS